MLKTLRVFEAFAGYGSQSLALDRLNIDYEVVGISENDKYAYMSYEALHGEVKNLGDIRYIDVDSVLDHDLFTYTFPCQSISKEGNKKGLVEGSGTTSSLVWECRPIIKSKKPKYLFMENVKNIISKAHIDEFNKWCKWLEEQGYTNYIEVHNSKHLLPQNRERVFMISFLGEHKEYKSPSIPNKRNIENILDDIGIPLFYLTEDGINIPSNSCINEDAQIIKSGVIRYEEGIVKVRQATKKGYIELEIPGICDLAYPNSKTRRGRVQEGGKLCPTLTATKNSLYIVNRDLSVRELTLHERFRLMGLKDREIDILINSKVPESQLYKQLGNSIVVDSLELVFKEFLSEYIIKNYGEQIC